MKGVLVIYFSIVIPVYNRCELLMNTLEALNYQQDYTTNDYEVIVVDDGSDESIFNNIHSVNKNYSLKYLFLPRCSQSCVARARNYGWKIANGEIIVFIDSDIIVKNDFLKEVGRSYQINHDLLVIGTRIMLDKKVNFEEIGNRSIFEKHENSVSLPALREFRYEVFDDYSYNFASIRYPWLLVFGCNMIIPKKWLEKTGGFDEKFIHWGQEDNELAYRLHIEGVKIVINSKLEVLHQFHGRAGNVEHIYFEGVKRNIDYLLSKHKTFIDLPTDKVYSLFKGELFFDYRLVQEEPEHHLIYKVFNMEDVTLVKESILNLANTSGYEVIVEDYLEISDLDIWLQLIDLAGSTVKYYPVSMKLRSEF